MLVVKFLRRRPGRGAWCEPVLVGSIAGRLLPGVLAVAALSSGVACADEVWVQVDEWRNPNPVYGDEYAATVAFSDGLGIVGAPYKMVNGEKEAGVVDVWNMANGRPYRRIEQPAIGSGNRFGRALAMQGRTGYIDNASGDIIYVFNVLKGTLLFTIEPDTSGYTGFGADLDVEGELLLVGAPNYYRGGRAYVFDSQTGAERSLLSGTGVGADYFEFGRAVDIDGHLGIVGSEPLSNHTPSGAAFIFDLESGTELLKLINPNSHSGDDFAAVVALGEGYAVVGAPGHDVQMVESAGSVHVFDAATGEYLHFLQEGALQHGSKFGHALAVHGGIAAIGSLHGPADYGMVWMADLESGEFTETVTVNQYWPNDEFGRAIAFNAETLLVGAPGRPNGEGTAVHFEKGPRAIRIEQVGTCPQALRIEVANLTPNATSTLFAGLHHGSYFTLRRPCKPGILLSIEPPLAGGTPINIMADANGSVSIPVTVPRAVCGRLYVQVIDPTRCEVSEALLIE